MSEADRSGTSEESGSGTGTQSSSGSYVAADGTSFGATGIPLTFRCFACGRQYKWLPEISGKSLRCKCGEKVRCPEPRDATTTGSPGLDDTVAEVVIDEHLDQIDRPSGEPAEAAWDTEEQSVRRLPQRGMFGWPIGREVLFWLIGSAIGLAMAILACIVGKYFIAYVIAAVLIAPLSWYRLYRAWPRWTQGRSWFQVLAEELGGDRDEG